ncbi:Dcm Site-specific DNA methylase [Caulobacteraceae bacterium]
MLENVLGLLTSKGGGDFLAIAHTLVESGYRIGALVVDARWFLPQSRPRVFVVAVQNDVQIPTALMREAAEEPRAPSRLRAVEARLPLGERKQWIWWSLPVPNVRPPRLADLLEDAPIGVAWDDAVETRRLLNSMSPGNRQKVELAKVAGQRMVGALYNRTRPDADGGRSVKAEVLFDGISGCLRTPGGGSSRQRLLIVEGMSLRSRLLSPREGARLMELSETYKLPARYNDAYHLCGDGVAVPVVRHLAAHILEPLAKAARTTATPAIAAERVLTRPP